MEDVLLSEVRPVIMSWASVAVIILLIAIFYLSFNAKKSASKSKARDKELKIFYSVIAFIFFWIAMLPFFISGAGGVAPDLLEWSHAVIVSFYAVFALLLLRDRNKK